MPLTDVKCRNAKGKTKPHKLSDGGGLQLLVDPDGAKYWRLAYRWHGKQRTLEHRFDLVANLSIMARRAVLNWPRGSRVLISSSTTSFCNI
jgi:hypothetical protein